MIGKLNGVMQAHDAERLAHDDLVDAARGAVLEVVAAHVGRDGGGRLDRLDGAQRLAARLGDRLAVLLGRQARELLRVPVHHLAQLEHVAAAHDRRGPAPGVEGVLRRLDGLVDLRPCVLQGTWAMTSPLAGSSTSMKRSVSTSTHSPPT